MTRSVVPSQSVHPKVVVILEPPSQAERIEEVVDDSAEVIRAERVEGDIEDCIEGRSSAFHRGRLEIKPSMFDGLDRGVGHQQGRGVGHTEIETLVVYFRLSTGMGELERMPELQVEENTCPALVVLMYGWNCEEEIHSCSG